jgi:hypothetical protein
MRKSHQAVSPDGFPPIATFRSAWDQQPAQIISLFMIEVIILAVGHTSMGCDT